MLGQSLAEPVTTVPAVSTEQAIEKTGSVEGGVWFQNFIDPVLDRAVQVDEKWPSDQPVRTVRRTENLRLTSDLENPSRA